ncbi:MAG: alpha/beta hydrolase, partial [Planctomycetia bacterium]|nr:alpha/beta hydrolase [Planctomycetia bacterium]
AAAGIDEGQVLAEVKQFFNHKQKLSDYSGPLLVMHTENDGLIDISHAERIYKWTGGSQKRLLRFRQGNHNSIMAYNYDEYFKSVALLARAASGDC